MGTTERKNSFDEAAAEFYVGTKGEASTKTWLL